MPWDTIKDYTNSFIGVAVIILGFILIPEIRKKRAYWVGFIIIGFFMVWLGFDKINRDRISNNLFQEKINSLLKTKTNDSTNRAVDSVKNLEFHKELLSKFNIKDSANKPVYMNKGNQVNVQDNHGKMDIKL